MVLPMSKSDSFALDKKIGKLLVAERLKRGLMQSEIAQLLRKSQSFVSKYESADRRLSVGDFVLVCRALGIKPSDFLKKYEK
jgi:transcriptional regulator with XRE-family HTH domain